MELSRSVPAQFFDYELSYRPMYENQLGKTLSLWDVTKQDSDENEDEMSPPSRKLRRAAELYSKLAS